MYNCEVCDTTCGPGEPLRRHVIHRQVPRRSGDGMRPEIAREVAVCQTCQQLLGGQDLKGLRRQRYNAGEVVFTGAVNRNGQSIAVRKRISEP